MLKMLLAQHAVAYQNFYFEPNYIVVRASNNEQSREILLAQHAVACQVLLRFLL
jgi:hypothetical protein